MPLLTVIFNRFNALLNKNINLFLMVLCFHINPNMKFKCTYTETSLFLSIDLLSVMKSLVLPIIRMTLGLGLDGSKTSYSSMSSAVSDKSESLSMENWLMGGRRSYLR